VLVLNALVRQSSDLLDFDQTHSAAMFSSKFEIFALQIHHIYSRGLGLTPPLELDILQKRFVYAKDISCFRVDFACSFVELLKYHGITLHANFKEHCKWAKK